MKRPRICHGLFHEIIMHIARALQKREIAIIKHWISYRKINHARHFISIAPREQAIFIAARNASTSHKRPWRKYYYTHEILWNVLLTMTNYGTDIAMIIKDEHYSLCLLIHELKKPYHRFHTSAPCTHLYYREGIITRDACRCIISQVKALYTIVEDEPIENHANIFLK